MSKKIKKSKDKFNRLATDDSLTCFKEDLDLKSPAKAKKKKAHWQLTVRHEFSAGHALRHYQGKCENPHGHNYHIELCVQGRKLTKDVEFLFDFTLLKAFLKKAVEDLDHQNINEVPPFDILNPSAENIAQYIYKKIKKELKNFYKNSEKSMNYGKVKIYSLAVSEKNTQTALYREI